MSFQKEEESILFDDGNLNTEFLEQNEQIASLFNDILWYSPFFHDNLIWHSPFFNDYVVWQELSKDGFLWEDIYYCIAARSDLQQTMEAAVSQEEDDDAIPEFFIIEENPRSTVDFCYYSSRDDMRVERHPCQLGSNVSTLSEEEYIHEEAEEEYIYEEAEEEYIQKEEEFLDSFTRWVNVEDSDDEAFYVVYDD